MTKIKGDAALAKHDKQKDGVKAKEYLQDKGREIKEHMKWNTEDDILESVCEIHYLTVTQYSSLTAIWV